MYTEKKPPIEVESFLMHYGVVGMKRGVRKKMEALDKRDAREAPSTPAIPVKKKPLPAKAEGTPPAADRGQKKGWTDEARAAALAARLKNLMGMTLSELLALTQVTNDKEDTNVDKEKTGKKDGGGGGSKSSGGGGGSKSAGAQGNVPAAKPPEKKSRYDSDPEVKKRVDSIIDDLWEGRNTRSDIEYLIRNEPNLNDGTPRPKEEEMKKRLRLNPNDQEAIEYLFT